MKEIRKMKGRKSYRVKTKKRVFGITKIHSSLYSVFNTKGGGFLLIESTEELNELSNEIEKIKWD